MDEKSYWVDGKQAVVHVHSQICNNAQDLLRSTVFQEILRRYWADLERHESPICKIIPTDDSDTPAPERLGDLLRILSTVTLDQAAGMIPWATHLTKDENRHRLHAFVEGLYDFWCSMDRYMVLHSEPGPSSFDQRPYRSFNAVVENLTAVVRAIYRDICENITNTHPRVYRQRAAGCDIGLIAVPREVELPTEYATLVEGIPFIRQVMIEPPMMIDPPMNKRTGRFEKIDSNPLHDMKLNAEKWLCFPALVGELTMFVYFHRMFMGLGCSLANLFELADDEAIARGPDAIYLFGAPPEALAQYGDLPTVFHQDDANDMFVAAVPAEERFGYFGYLKKMILTLHNAEMMKRGRMPFHGAMVRVILKDDKAATILIIGDTAAGKSESLEAFRNIGDHCLEDMQIIADDMGSLAIDENGRVLGYGTEIGAFVRLDDLQQGFAFQQIDRAIFMSPHKVNARVVLPVTTMDEVLHGYPIDYMLYANNYESVDEDHPILDRFPSCEAAIDTFREGAAMAKGTTTSTGLVHSYFANIFGAPQYREIHEELARATFKAAHKSGVFLGQIRTRLGIPGFETTGPEEVAKALLDTICANA